jgi:hypothetical protein
MFGAKKSMNEGGCLGREEEEEEPCSHSFSFLVLKKNPS